MLATSEPAVQRSFGPGRAALVLEPSHDGLGCDAVLLGAGPCSIGTAQDCTLRVDAAGIAPRHAQIICGPAGAVLRACDPRTWLNDGPVTEKRLRAGDRLAIGPVEFRIRRAALDELLPATPPPARRTAPAAPQPAFERLDPELVRQRDSLEEEIARRRRKLKALLARRKAVADDLASRRQAAAQTHRQIARAERKEALLAELLSDVQQAASDLIVRERVLAERVSAQQEQLARLQNEAAIEAASFRQRRDSPPEPDAKLQRAAEELATLRGECHASRIQLDGEWESLKTRQQAIAEDARQIEAQRQSLAAAEQELARSRANFRQERESFEERLATIDRRFETLREEAARLDDLRQELRGERETLAAREDELELRWREHQAELERRVRAAQPSSPERPEPATADRNEAGLAREGEQLARRGAELDRDRQQLEAEREELQQRQDESRRRGVELDRRAKELQQQVDVIDRRSDQVAEREARAADAEAALAARRAELEAQRKDLEAERRQIDEEKSRIAAESAEHDSRMSSAEPAVGSPGERDDERSSPDFHPAPSEILGLRDATESPDAAAAPQPPAKLERDGSDDPVSVAAYMEQLLARVRRSPYGTNVPAPPPAAGPVEALEDSVETAQPEHPHLAVSEPRPERTAVPPWASKPRSHVDRDSVRADLASLRQVANLSARSAIAAYTWKRLRGTILLKSLLMFVSFILAGVLLSDRFWGVTFAATGWAAAAVGGVMAVTLARTLLLLYDVIPARERAESDELADSARSEAPSPEDADRAADDSGY